MSLRNVWSVLRKRDNHIHNGRTDYGYCRFCACLVLRVGMEVMIVVGLTLVSITVWSAIVSSVIPMVLKRLGIDPAVVSAPFIATLIDGTGLIIYFEIASHVMSFA